MQWVLAFHVVFVVCWFAGLFYLPRLFVYHAQSNDQIGIDRFKIMERKLYRGIMTPSGVLATIFGLWYLIVYWPVYKYVGWMRVKLTLVVLLWIYHLVCHKYLIDFREDRNKHSPTFYRFFNEIPVLFLMAIVILVFVRPW